MRPHWSSMGSPTIFVYFHSMQGRIPSGFTKNKGHDVEGHGYFSRFVFINQRDHSELSIWNLPGGILGHLSYLNMSRRWCAVGRLCRQHLRYTGRASSSKVVAARCISTSFLRIRENNTPAFPQLGHLSQRSSCVMDIWDDSCYTISARRGQILRPQLGDLENCDTKVRYTF